MRILFLSRWFPYPVENGAKIRIYNMLKGLACDNTVDLISFYEEENIEAGLSHLRKFLGEIHAVPYLPFRSKSINSLKGFFDQTPRSVSDTYSVELAETLDKSLKRKSYDLVVASQIDMAIYGLTLHGPKKILEELEVTKILAPYLNETRPFMKFRKGLTWWKLARYVRRILDEYDGCTVVSGNEQHVVTKILPTKPPVVIPNGVDCSYYRIDHQTLVEPDTIIFNGSITYSVNFQAVDYFIRKILPLIQTHRPQVRIFITGKVKQELINQLPHNEGLVFTGFLDDIRTTLTRSWLTVVPLTIGGGTRLKILESMAAGVPVVSTTIGAEGLDVVSGRDLLIADRPNDFADAVLSVLHDFTLRKRLAENGRMLVETKYDWQKINQQLDGYLSQVAIG